MNKENEVLIIWESIIKNMPLSDGYKYDFDKLIPYLVVFYDVPQEFKEEAIYKFYSLLHFFIHENNKKYYVYDRHPIAFNYSRVISDELYKKVKKELKIAEAFLEMVTQDKKHLECSDRTIIDIKNVIKSCRGITEVKAVTKTQIKTYLLKMNKHFNLKKTYQIKELIDNI
jgi:hypothetical protein